MLSKQRFNLGTSLWDNSLTVFTGGDKVLPHANLHEFLGQVNRTLLIMVLTDVFFWQNWVIPLVGLAQGSKRNTILHVKFDSGKQNTRFVLESDGN